jgi:hypothetical protein
MFEVNMDEYLEEEIEYIKNNLNNICANWEKQVSLQLLTDRSWQLTRALVRLVRNSSQGRSPIDLLVIIQPRSNEAQCACGIPGRALATSDDRSVDRFLRC